MNSRVALTLLLIALAWVLVLLVAGLLWLVIPLILEAL